MKPRSLDLRAALAAAVLLSLSSLAAAAAPATGPAAPAAGAAATPAPAAKPESDDALREQWVKRYEEVRTRHASLKRDLDQARADYTRGRTAHNLQGPGRAGLVEEIKRLEEELAKADQELQDFPDEARRAGALPGWFRDLEGDAPPAQAGLPQLDSRRPKSARSETLSGRTVGASARETDSAEETPSDEEDSASRQEQTSRSEQLRQLKRDDAKSRRLP